ncbi:MAG: PEGA domain-containing protein [Lacunisphaera sp.]
MPTKLSSLLLAVLFSASSLLAETPPARTTVQTKTYDEGDKTVTEHTVTTVVKEEAAKPKPEADKPKEYTVAIFVTNRAGKAGDTELGALEDYITSHVTELNVHVISGETALNAVASLAPGAKTNELDAQLAKSTSAVRLAETLGATHLLQVSLSGFDSTKKSIDAYGVKTTNVENTVRVTYKILDGTTGGSLAADTVRVSKTFQSGEGSNEEHSSLLNGLLDDAAGKVAMSLKHQIDRGRITTSAAQGEVAVTITTELADVFVPDVRIGPENTVSISDSKFKVSALAATVEIDGIAVGTAPGTLVVKKGLHKLRVVREGYKPWERTVNFANGQRLNVGLEMTDAGYARWKDATGFMNDLKNGAKLTDAQVKALEGRAKMLENSGYKVNSTEGVKTLVGGNGFNSLFNF